MAIVPTFRTRHKFSARHDICGFNPVTGPQTVDFSTAVKNRDKKLEDLKKLFTDAENYAKVKDAYAKDKTLPSVPLGFENWKR